LSYTVRFGRSTASDSDGFSYCYSGRDGKRVGYNCYSGRDGKRVGYSDDFKRCLDVHIH
jgi:hypothetical protein